MTSSGAWRVDAADLPNWLSPALREALPAALGEARAQCAPAVGRDFKRTVTAALVLVAGVGMTQDESRAWQAAAAETLRGIPADLLEMGCAAARRTADHPSKIVPAIIGAVGRMWDDRRTDLARLQRIAAAADRPPPAPLDICPPAAAAEIMAEFGMRSTAGPAASARCAPVEPTIADYLELGLSADEARDAIEQRRRLLSRQRPRPIGDAAERAVDETARKIGAAA